MQSFTKNVRGVGMGLFEDIGKDVEYELEHRKVDLLGKCSKTESNMENSIQVEIYEWKIKYAVHL